MIGSRSSLIPFMLLLMMIFLMIIPLPLPQHKLSIQAHNSPNNIPIPIKPNPIRNKDTSRPVSPLFLTMSPAKMINSRRVEFRRNLLRPCPPVKEVTCAQEIDVEWMGPCSLGAREDAERVARFARALAVLGDVLDLLVDVLAFEDLVKVLDDDLAAGAGCVGAVVGPPVGVDAPASPAVDFLELLEDVEAADEDDLAAGFAEGGDFRVRIPPTALAGVVVADYAAELLVGVASGSLAFERDDEGLGGVVFEEVDDFALEVAEVFVSC